MYAFGVRDLCQYEVSKPFPAGGSFSLSYQYPSKKRCFSFSEVKFLKFSLLQTMLLMSYLGNPPNSKSRRFSPTAPSQTFHRRGLYVHVCGPRLRRVWVRVHTQHVEVQSSGTLPQEPSSPLLSSSHARPSHTPVAPAAPPPTHLVSAAKPRAPALFATFEAVWTTPSPLPSQVNFQITLPISTKMNIGPWRPRARPLLCLSAVPSLRFATLCGF